MNPVRHPSSNKSAPAAGSTEPVACKRCKGKGVVDDGEINHYSDGTPYANGPVKCVKDCPSCNGSGRAPTVSKAPIARLRFQRGTPGHENDMPEVVSCDWLPDGVYSAYLAAEAVPPASSAPIQGGLTNPELFAAWGKKLPGVKPTDAQISAFAIGIEVGFDHARDLEKQDWSRVHDVLKKHGKHPGRTDDHLADVIDRALAASNAAEPAGGCAPAALVPIEDHNRLTLAYLPYGGQRISMEAFTQARSVYGTTSEEDDKRVYRTLQAAFHATQPAEEPTDEMVVAMVRRLLLNKPDGSAWEDVMRLAYLDARAVAKKGGAA